MKLYTKIIAVFVLFFSISCTKVVEKIIEVPAPSEPPVVQEPTVSTTDYIVEVAENEFKVMAYNVENLFDTLRDPKHQDWTYLPKGHPEKESGCMKMKPGYYRNECLSTDWTEEKLNLKIEQLARVIEAQGKAPELIGLEEVENAEVARRLGRRLGLSGVLATTGSDSRGINNIILYKEDKLQFLHSREAVVDLGKHSDTRNILAGYFKVKGSADIFGFYVNHWPSQGNAATERVKAGAALQKMIEQDFALYGADFHPVAVGDFNTVPDDSPHPFIHTVLNPAWKKNMISVNDWFYNYEWDEAQLKIVKRLYSMPNFTYMYKNLLQTLDYIFADQNLADGKGLEVVLESFRIVAPIFSSKKVIQKFYDESGDLQVQAFLAPQGFDNRATEPGSIGASDHYPIVVKFKVNPK